MFEIEGHVPAPAKQVGHSKGRPQKYPFDGMNVGDSFVVSAPRFNAGKQLNAVATAARNWALRYAPGRKFSCRRRDGGVRVWRVASFAILAATLVALAAPAQAGSVVY